MYKINFMNPAFVSQDKIFSVTELNNLIKELLEGAFPPVVVEGEISNYRPNSSGHLYFTLKDSTNQISAVMFKSAAWNLQFVPKDGMKVQCTARLSVYGPQGKYQLVISKMSVAGEGAILKMIEDRKRRFYAEGLFDESHKKPLPQFPERIGVVTSPNGAALRDILQITKRRNKCVSVVILPAVVQGDGAAQTIAAQIRAANQFNLCDVLIVGRGGGSLEDLLPFSEEIVVRAVAESSIPVISAVGHEIDWALSDYAADRRAPTPSAAAEMAVPLLADITNGLSEYRNDLYNSMMNLTSKYRMMVKSFDPQNLEIRFRNIEQPLLNRFENAKSTMLQNLETRLENTRQYISSCISILETSSPDTILKRGYSMIREKETGRIITAAEPELLNKEIEIIPAKGKITARVEKIENK